MVTQAHSRILGTNINEAGNDCYSLLGRSRLVYYQHVYCRYKSANIIGQDNKFADVAIRVSCSGSTRRITAWFEMEDEEYQLITKFLSSSAEFREWPPSVNTRDQKTNFHRKCTKYQLVSDILHYMHTKHGASSRLQRNSQSSKLATVRPPQVMMVVMVGGDNDDDDDENKDDDEND